MRGLDAKCAIALARTSAIIDPTQVDLSNTHSLLSTACRLARNDGSADFRSGEHDLPLLFVGESELTVSWHAGYGIEKSAKDFADICRQYVRLGII